jgi:hypothetical protein
MHLDKGGQMLKLTKKALAAVAVTSATVLTLQQPGVASAATLRAFGVRVNALGVTLAETPVSDVNSPNNTASNITAGSLLSAGTLATSVSIDPVTGTENATATVQGLTLNFLAASITAGAVNVQCTAVVGQTPTGSTTVVNGVITGPLGIPTITIPANPAPNTSFGIPGIATIVVNEQISNPDGSLTVNGLHLTILGPTGGDVVVSSATCGPAAVPVPMVSAPGALTAGGLAMLGFAGFRGWRRLRARRGAVLA